MPRSSERASEKCCNVGQMERLASVVAGASILMTMGGLRSLRGIVATTVGAGLIYRGITGHSPIYERLGIDSTDIGQIQPMERVEV
jgi:uncharacterized membrane protein